MISNLVAHATGEFKLDRVLKNSSITLREHLESAEEQTGRTPDELAELRVERLPEVDHVWSTFRQLHRMRGDNGFRPDPLTPQMVQGWLSLTGERLRPWELRAIFLMDAVFRRVTAENTREQGE